MKFITEIDLRSLYKDDPFTWYKIKPDIKLTPGARQFLVDKKIKISEENPMNSAGDKESIEEKDWREKKLISKIKSVEAIFLLTAEKLLDIDVLLAQDIIKLSKEFTNIRNALEGKESLEYINCNNCTGIDEENFSQTLDDCFDITSFHIQLDKGKEIIVLHRLRCSLGEIEAYILEYSQHGQEDELYKEVIKKNNQIINTLSQMICSIVGGKICQRKR